MIAEGGVKDYFGMLVRPSWSSDGKMVAAASGWRKDKYTTAIRCYPVDGGEPVILPSRKWVFQVIWLRNQTGLLLDAAPAPVKAARNQIWLQPFPQGEPQRIINDLTSYWDLSLTADEKLLAGIQSDSTSAVFVGRSSDPDHGVPITTAKLDGLDVEWTRNGDLLMQDARGQYSLAQADGKRRVSFFQDELAEGHAAVCGDGRFIVFSSPREGSQVSIWRVGTEGHNLKRLTNAQNAFDPHCSSKGDWVAYETGRGPAKVAIEGGPEVSFERGDKYGPARYSPDGKLIAFYDTADPTKIIVISSAGGPPVKTFDLAPAGSLNYFDYSLLHWTPDGRALTYPLLAGNEMNLWYQPISGGSPRQITHFHESILAYDWSPDGKRLAITRAKSSADVVLTTADGRYRSTGYLHLLELVSCNESKEAAIQATRRG
jgi:Tol biopolymer transport system component